MSSLLWMIVVLLVVAWALGLFAFHVVGGLIHVLLIIALVVIIYNLIQMSRGSGTRL
jgi:hypothetical protein